MCHRAAPTAARPTPPRPGTPRPPPSRARLTGASRHAHPFGRRYRRATSATRQAREVEPARPVSAFWVFAHSLVEEVGVVTDEDPPGAATHAVEDDGGRLRGRHRRR